MIGGRFLNRNELTAMTIAEIKDAAEDSGIEITAKKKADIIDEFLAQQ